MMEAPENPPEEARRQDTTVGSGIDFSDPNSKLAPYYLRTTSVIFAGAIALILALYSQQSLYYTDVWVHLKHGSFIAETGKLTGPDPFSPFADPHANRPAFYWLTQLGYHGLFQAGAKLAGGDESQRLAGGAELLRQGHTLAIVAIFALFWFGYRRVTASGSLALLGLLLLFAGAVATIGVHRPQLFALVWFAAIYAILAKERLKIASLIAIPFLMVLWVNTHGSYPVGLALIAVTLIGRAWDSGLKNALANRDWWRLLFAGAIGAAALSLLNPDGLRTWQLTYGFSQSPNLRVMLEWQPLNFSDPQGGPWFYWGSLLLLAVAQALSPRGFTATEVLLTLTFGIAPLFQERFMAWWLPLCIGIILNHLNAWAAKNNWVWKPSLPSFRKTILAVALLFFGVMLTPLATWAQGEAPQNPAAILHPATPFGLSEALDGRPAGERFAPLVQALKQLNTDSALGPIFTSESLGEFLYWRGSPGTVPMIFTHAHLFPPEYWDAAMQAKSGRPGWWEFLDRYGVNIVAVEALQPNRQPLSLVLELAESPDWNVVIDERGRTDIRDPKARIFVAVRKHPLKR